MRTRDLACNRDRDELGVVGHVVCAQLRHLCKKYGISREETLRVTCDRTTSRATPTRASREPDLCDITCDEFIVNTFADESDLEYEQRL
jgi:hypothetical protein